MKRKPTSKILLDTSVLLTAYGSSSGGSSIIINHQGEAYRCVITTTILAEALGKSEKFQTDEDALRACVTKKNILVVQSATEEEKKSFTTVVMDKKDRHVLASAKHHEVSVLLSYDRKHIVTSSIKKVLAPILVMTPKEFLIKKPL